MREIVLDTETTGLEPNSGHRVVEIGCVELVNHVKTGATFQSYVNPERDMPEQAFAIHGLSEEFLAKQPTFADVAEAFIQFIADATLVIHNAEFDIGFINAELQRLDRQPITMERVIDTVQLARRKFPGAQANLNSLCRRFRIDNSERKIHGALKDACLLACVYLELLGGQQTDLKLSTKQEHQSKTENQTVNQHVRRPHLPSPEEERTHAEFIDKLETPIWRA